MDQNRVLIVDDDARIGRIIKRIATTLHVDASVTDNPADFESVYLKCRPNVIFMDLQMPDIDGIELLRGLASARSNAAIFLMSGVDKSVLSTAVEFGKSLGLNMAGILLKPFDIEKVKEAIVTSFSAEQHRNPHCIELTASELGRAIEDNQLIVHYQPQVSFKTRKVVAAEALVRWQHPEHGLLFPASFIPLAETDTELMGQLTRSVIEIALRDDRQRREQSVDINLCINLSAILLNDRMLPEKIEQLLNLHNFDPRRLVLEITESGAMEDPSITMDILTRLRLKNVRLSIDDFGTGFSSLAQLYTMPFNELKVDKSFVMAAAKDHDAAEITRLTVELGCNLGLDVVAEGVEDQTTYDYLRSLGCDYCQGYHISRPISAPAFLSWLKECDRDDQLLTG